MSHPPSPQRHPPRQKLPNDASVEGSLEQAVEPAPGPEVEGTTPESTPTNTIE